MRFLILTIVGSVVFLAVDTTPGLFTSALLCPCFSFGLFGVAVVGWSALGLWAAARPRPTRWSKRWLYAASGVAALAVLLWFAEVPRRVVLWTFRREFEALLANAPRAYSNERLSRWVGCFYVEEYEADEEGGVFFRTASHPDGISPDTMSYGVCVPTAS
jgi:hypothetical protein